jgi:hypothetical protein
LVEHYGPTLLERLIRDFGTTMSDHSFYPRCTYKKYTHPNNNCVMDGSDWREYEELVTPLRMPYSERFTPCRIDYNVMFKEIDNEGMLEEEIPEDPSEAMDKIINSESNFVLLDTTIKQDYCGRCMSSVEVPEPTQMSAQGYIVIDKRDNQFVLAAGIKRNVRRAFRYYLASFQKCSCDTKPPILFRNTRRKQKSYYYLFRMRTGRERYGKITQEELERYSVLGKRFFQRICDPRMVKEILDYVPRMVHTDCDCLMFFYWLIGRTRDRSDRMALIYNFIKDSKG